MIIIIIFSLILISIIITLYIKNKSCDTFIYSIPKSLEIAIPVSNIIPKKLLQTYISKEKVPQKVFDNIQQFASDYEYTFFSNKEQYEFIKDNYDSSILDAYNNLQNLAHKSDVFRYCYLYKYGGVYLDIKIELIKPLNQIFNNNYVYTVLSSVGGTICQGIIATPPKNKIFLKLIDYAKTLSKNIAYSTFTRDFYNKVSDDTGNTLVPGVNIGKSLSYYLYIEKCTTKSDDCYDGLDKYGKCCFIYDKDIPIIKVRYSDYPW